MDKAYQIVYVDNPAWEIIGGGISDYNTQQAGDDQGKNLCYEVFGKLHEFPPGHQRYFLTKQL